MALAFRRGDPMNHPHPISVQDALDYCPETGVIRWKVKRSKAVAGMIAGTIRNGYIRIYLSRKSYEAHYVAWFLMTGSWPTCTIDHRNLNGLDNRWCNLREATWSQQNANRRAVTDMPKGVHIASSGKFVAQIYHLRKYYYIGSFDTAEQAHAAYYKKAVELFGEFARAA